MGASRYVALYRTKLARVLLAQDRDEAAAAELERAQDVRDAPAWRIADARVRARRGRTEEAVVLARDVVASLIDRDNITAHAELLVDLAEVLRAHGDLDSAAAALEEAIALHEEKGNVLPAERCRELLAATAG